MEWVIGALVACAAVGWGIAKTRPRVAAERVAAEDVPLVREGDRARWRRVRLGTYRSWKRQDDFYRIAAYRKHVAGGMAEAQARERVRKEFPIYYLDPDTRDTEGFTGEDGALPIALRERVNANARVLKELMEEQGASFRTMNALIRVCLRRKAF